jgi:hypothetical protein
VLQATQFGSLQMIYPRYQDAILRAEGAGGQVKMLRLTAAHK